MSSCRCLSAEIAERGWGYGFIQPEDGSKDVFVHISAVERSGLGHLVEGQQISYQLERGQQGKTSAVDLQAA